MHVERRSEKERVRGLRGVPEGGGSHGDSVRSGGRKRERERRRRSGVGTRPTRSNRHGGREGKVKRRETKRGREETERKREENDGGDRGAVVAAAAATAAQRCSKTRVPRAS